MTTAQAIAAALNVTTATSSPRALLRRVISNLENSVSDWEEDQGALADAELQAMLGRERERIARYRVMLTTSSDRHIATVLEHDPTADETETALDRLDPR